MQIFAPLVKVDTERREVWGVLVEERVDKSGEVFDYATSKAHFEKWNSDFSKATEGKSVGNLRSMHTNIAAGKFVSMEYDDANKRVIVGAKVVDDAEWNKVLEGVYTGFSIGGKYLKRWFDAENNATRYTAKPSEGSLVDNPCMYGATFTVLKGEGVEEIVKFTGGASSMTDEQKARLTELLGKGEDITDVEKAELADLQKAAEGHHGSMMDEGDKSDNDKDETEGGDAKKPADGEGGTKKCETCGKPMKGEGACTGHGDAHKAETVDVEALKKSVSDEVHGIVVADIQKATEQVSDLQKSVSDAVSKMTEAVQGFEGLQKSFTDLSKAHEDLLGKHADVLKAFDGLTSENEKLAKRVEELEKQPAAGGAVLMSVTKGAGIDGQGADEASVLKSLIANTHDLMAKQALSSQLAMIEMKKIHQSPTKL